MASVVKNSKLRFENFTAKSTIFEPVFKHQAKFNFDNQNITAICYFKD